MLSIREARFTGSPMTVKSIRLGEAANRIF
jgi:hypothetical protein